jgi:hypothetical protein
MVFECRLDELGGFWMGPGWGLGRLSKATGDDWSEVATRAKIALGVSFSGYRHTSAARAGHALGPRLNRDQDVSTKLRRFTARSPICLALSLSRMTMGPPQRGQDHEEGGSGEAGQAEDNRSWAASN